MSCRHDDMKLVHHLVGWESTYRCTSCGHWETVPERGYDYKVPVAEIAPPRKPELKLVKGGKS